MKLEYVRHKREGDEHATHVAGIRLIAESDLEKGVLKEFGSEGIKINATEMGFRWMELTYRSLIKSTPTEPHPDYIPYAVHVHKGWLPMLQALQEARTFGTRKPTKEDILEELVLRKLQESRDALSDIVVEVNAPKKGEEDD